MILTISYQIHDTMTTEKKDRMQYMAISQPFSSLCLSFLYLDSNFLYAFLSFDEMKKAYTMISGIKIFSMKKSMLSLE